MPPQVPTLLLFPCLLILCGCDASAGASVIRSTPAARPTAASLVPHSVATTRPADATATPTSPAALRSTSTVTAEPLTTSAAAPTPSPTSPTGLNSAGSAPVRVVAAAVRPGSVVVGGRLALSATTIGAVQRVEMYLGSGEPNAPAPLVFRLAQSAPGLWSGTGHAPLSAGSFHYTVGVYSSGNHRTVVDNDGWNIEVGSTVAGASSAVIPLYGDIPLAPPYSYGNPVAAVFNWSAKTVHGSEVVSNARPDIAASTVAQFYSVHFPRAGWTTMGGGAADGATSFSMSATSGSRVCIVQFSEGTVHIFYGSTTG